MKWNTQHKVRLQLNNHKEQYLNIRDILRQQHADFLEEIKRAQEKEDYTTLKIVLAKMSDIGSELKLVNRKINMIDHKLSMLSKGQ